MRSSKEISVCFFDDEQSLHFQPLTLTRPMDDLRVGIRTIREKWLADLKTERFQRVPRPELFNLFPCDGEPAGMVLWINSRLLPDPEIISQALALPMNGVIQMNGTLLVCRTDAQTTRAWLRNGMPGNLADPEADDSPATTQLSSGRTSSVRNVSPVRNASPDRNSKETASDRIFSPASEPVLLEQLWDLLRYNAAEIAQDIVRDSGLEQLKPRAADGIYIYGEHPVWVSPEIHLEPGLTFVTLEGPVFIGKGATIMAGSIVRGPAAICEGSVVKMGAKIYGNTTIGPVCKVGGEINSAIFHSYTNKAHEGYAGNSIFGQWCNLGADTNTSNLKNNYQTVRFPDWPTGEEQDTGELFLGTVMGDHGKTGINAMLSTGTNCGVCCNLFSHGYPPKLIPSFSWVNSVGITPYLFDKAVETMRRTMKRRKVTLSEEYVRMMRHIFENRLKVENGSGSLPVSSSRSPGFPASAVQL